jgi:hypothetical protein
VPRSRSSEGDFESVEEQNNSTVASHNFFTIINAGSLKRQGPRPWPSRPVPYPALHVPVSNIRLHWK